MLLFTTVNKRSWVIEVVDQLTVPVKLVVFRASQNQEKSESALPQLSRGSNNAMWTRKSGLADPPETSICKWLAAWQSLIGPQCLTLTIIPTEPKLSLDTQISSHRISKQPQQEVRKSLIWQEVDCKMSWQCGWGERFCWKEFEKVPPKTFPRI